MSPKSIKHIQKSVISVSYLINTHFTEQELIYIVNWSKKNNHKYIKRRTSEKLEKARRIT